MAQGCPEGYSAMATPPEPLGTWPRRRAVRFCLAAVCQSSDCCLRRAQGLPALGMNLVAWNAVEVWFMAA